MDFRCQTTNPSRFTSLNSDAGPRGYTPLSPVALCGGEGRIAQGESASLTRKRAEVQILLRPQLFWLLRGQFWSSDDPVSKPRDTARIPRAAKCPTCLTTSAASGVVA